MGEGEAYKQKFRVIVCTRTLRRILYDYTQINNKDFPHTPYIAEINTPITNKSTP